VCHLQEKLGVEMNKSELTTFMTFNKLKLENGHFQVNRKKSFNSVGYITYKQYCECKSFAEKMANGNDGEHRAKRSGGIKVRSPEQIFKDTIRGKLGEFAVFNYLISKELDVEPPDIQTYPLGKWDDVDIEYKNKKINIKTTKYFGNLLLLESKDWDEEGNYIPNIKFSNSRYDYFVFVRLRKIKSNDNKLGFLIAYDIVGYITNEDLQYIIKNNYLLGQGYYLNNTKMDADNYYIQADDFRDISELFLR
jgi:hypothetical protein